MGMIRPGDHVDMGGRSIHSLADGVDPGDAVNLGQLLAQGGGGAVSGYGSQNVEKTGSFVYVGYEHQDGRWFIYRRTIASNLRQYATGVSSYSTNWAGRAGLTYA